jgi:hypothetical protein
VQAWGVEPTIEDGVTTARERYSYGSSFPTTPIETINESSAAVSTETTCHAPIDYKAVPELPEIDPRTVSESNMEFAAARRPGFFATEVSSSGNSENSADQKEIQADTLYKVFPEVRDDTKHKVEETNSFQQIYIDKLDVYPMEGERFKSPLKKTPYSGLPTSPSSSAMASNERIENIDSYLVAPAALIDQMNEHRHAPAGPAPRPVVALEETIAESFFSSTNDKADLSLSVQLELSGESSSDQVLTLFGEAVHVDEQGHFSVRLKLDKSPQLAALLRAQRKSNLEGH